MARQKGAVKLTGSIGELSFYERKKEFLAKQKGGPTSEQVLCQDRFERTRENEGEFGRCSSAGKLIRTALLEEAASSVDTTAASRLLERLMRVLKSDTKSLRGKRTIQGGQLPILERFKFLQQSRLSESFFAPYQATLDREAGTATVALAPFVPKVCLTVPPMPRG